MRPRLLYNPNLESERFFVPGLVGIILQLVTLFLTSFAIVRERELGTLEQLFVTPVGRAGLLLGKLLPYAVLAFVEVLAVLVVMVYVFGVPIRGRLDVLLSLSLLFLAVRAGFGSVGIHACENPVGGDSVRLHHHAAFGAAVGIYVSPQPDAHADLPRSPSPSPSRISWKSSGASFSAAPASAI